MPEPQNTFQRQIAYKIRISDLLSAFAEDAAGVRLNNANVSRVNIIATIVDKSDGANYANAVIDDGTGRIAMRSFEAGIFSGFDLGEVILVVGRIREFSNERYLMPEILKKIKDIGWLGARKLELEKSNVHQANDKSAVEKPTAPINEEVYSMIKKLDDGNGASFDDIVKMLGSSEAEDAIKRLLENGDIFELKPGKLKVLE